MRGIRLRVAGLVACAFAFGPFLAAAQASKMEPGPKATSAPGSLAFTGLNTELIVALGVVLIVAGALLRHRLAPARSR